MKLTRNKGMYALICNDGYGDDLLCGVYPSLKEVRKVAKEIKDCPCRHTIRKCSVVVTIK